MKTISFLRPAAVALAVAASAATASAAGSITVHNNSGISLDADVYTTCIGGFGGVAFKGLGPGGSQTQPRNWPVQGGCVWARAVTMAPQLATCFAMTTSLADPSEPGQITVTWFGSSADDLGCAINVSGVQPSGGLVAPTGLTATLVSSNSGPAVQLGWLGNPGSDHTYALERQADGGIFVGLGTLGGDAAGFVDYYAPGGNTYTYRVRACNSGGCSAFSNEASITIAP